MNDLIALAKNSDVNINNLLRDLNNYLLLCKYSQLDMDRLHWKDDDDENIYINVVGEEKEEPSPIENRETVKITVKPVIQDDYMCFECHMDHISPETKEQKLEGESVNICGKNFDDTTNDDNPKVPPESERFEGDDSSQKN